MYRYVWEPGDNATSTWNIGVPEFILDIYAPSEETKHDISYMYVYLKRFM